MKTITCKRCGAQIDPTVGECPVCGAIYYVLSESPETEQAAPTPTDWDEPEQTRTFQAQQRPTAPQPRPRQPATPRPERPTPPPARETGHRRRKRRMAAGFAVAALALLAVLTVVLCVIGGVFDFAGKDTDKMPYVVGQTEENARTMLEGLNLRVEITTSDSEEAAGVVIGQSIPEGRSLKGNETVTLSVSNGRLAQPVVPNDAPPDTVEAPYVLDENYDSARLRVESMGLYLVRYSEEFSEQPEGVILRQDPAAGTPVQPGSAISVTISKGPEPVEYTVSVTAGKGGSVSPRGQVTVPEGEKAEFVIVPDEGYVIREVKIDGQDMGPVERYMFEDVTADHTLYVVFQLAPEETDPPEETQAPDETEPPVQVPDRTGEPVPPVEPTAPALP